MTAARERAVYRVRLLLVDLLASFFQAEPDAEKMSRWRGVFSALVKERVNPVFDRAVVDIHGILNERSLADLQREYYELFVNPFGSSRVHTMASWYLDGRSFGQTLVSLRAFLAEAGFVREEGVTESEDSLPVLLDFLAHLIEDEKKRRKPGRQPAADQASHRIPGTFGHGSHRRGGTTAGDRFLSVLLSTALQLPRA